MPISSLYSKVEGALDVLVGFAERFGKGLRGDEQPYNDDINTTSIETKGPDRLKPEEMIGEFDRKPLKPEYDSARTVNITDLEKSGSGAEVILITMEHDFLSSLQRDFMSRQQTRLSIHADALNRAKMMGDKEYSPFEAGTRKALKSMLAYANSDKKKAPGENPDDLA